MVLSSQILYPFDRHSTFKCTTAVDTPRDELVPSINSVVSSQWPFPLVLLEIFEGPLSASEHSFYVLVSMTLHRVFGSVLLLFLTAATIIIGGASCCCQSCYLGDHILDLF